MAMYSVIPCPAWRGRAAARACERECGTLRSEGFIDGSSMSDVRWSHCTPRVRRRRVRRRGAEDGIASEQKEADGQRRHSVRAIETRTCRLTPWV